MKKNEFLNGLSLLLTSLPPEELQATLDYYAEMIDDKMEEGLSEEEAVSTVGSMNEIARSVLENKTEKNEEKNKKKRFSTLELMLIILGSPIWLSLGIAALAVIISIYAVIWSVLISVYAVVIALIASGIASIFVAPIIISTGRCISGLILLGAGFICVGLTYYAFLLCILMTKSAVKASIAPYKFIISRRNKK